MNSTTANAWTLRLLLTQLYDPAMEVCETATHFLEEACESMDVLQLVVAMQPTLDHLGEIGHTLLLRFTSTPMGFRYLYNASYIDREMDIWYNVRLTCPESEAATHGRVGTEPVLRRPSGGLPGTCL